MKLKRTKVATLAATLLTFGSLAGGANAAIIMTISDDGSNLTLRATGSFDLSNATSIGSGNLGAGAAVAPTFNAFGFDAGADGVWYAANFSGILIGTSDAYPSSSLTTTIPVWVDFDGRGADPKFAAPLGVTSGTVDETAIFTGVTIASLGMVPGQSVTGSWGLGGVDEQITVTVASVPEPSSALLLGLGALGFAARRRRIN